MLGKLLRNALSARNKTGKPVPAAGTMTLAQANAALERRDHAAAALIYQHIVQIEPDNQEAWNKLGFCQAALGQYRQSEHSFGQLARLVPHSRTAHANIGHLALMDLRLAEATTHLRTALACPPDANAATADAVLNSSLGFALMRQGLPEEAMVALRNSLREQPANWSAAAHLLFTMQHAPSVRPDELFAEFRRWSEVHETPLFALHKPHANAPQPDRRLRIGYVSGDFARHAVSNFIAPVLQQHDRAGFEIHCYSNRAQADDRTAELRGLSDHWHDIFTLDDEALAAQVRADGMDILVDLSGHTHGNRMGVFARKPAPLQMTWLGYPTTTGLRSMDCRISDAYADPPGVAEAFHSERLLRLPRSQWCYRADAAAPEVSALPAQTVGRVKFGSFNNLAKLNDAVLALWARVLQAVPGSGITVVSRIDEGNRERLAAALVRHGAAPERVRIIGDADDAEFWRIREDIDIVLDAFPYNGTTTTCEALWSGLPVVTLAGPFGAARNTASLLAAVGLQDLIATDQAGYVAIAAALAADIPKLAVLRAGMRQRLLDAGLCDGPRFTRELENLYRLEWQHWCAGRAP